MIDDIYINEAKRIREEYLNNLVYITKEEQNITNLTVQLQDLAKDIENSDEKDETFYKDALFEIEIMIRKATDKIFPYHDKIKELDKAQKNLYDKIKDKYPKISDQDIQDSIIPHILELDNSEMLLPRHV